jgi:hypothetical protein
MLLWAGNVVCQNASLQAVQTALTA